MTTPTQPPPTPLTDFAGHTPGPWRCDSGDGGWLTDIYAGPKGQGGLIARVPSYSGNDKTVPIEHQPHNARLIAAAPRLLAERNAALAALTEAKEALADAMEHVPVTLQGRARRILAGGGATKTTESSCTH